MTFASCPLHNESFISKYLILRNFRSPKHFPWNTKYEYDSKCCMKIFCDKYKHQILGKIWCFKFVKVAKIDPAANIFPIFFSRSRRFERFGQQYSVFSYLKNYNHKCASSENVIVKRLFRGVDKKSSKCIYWLFHMSRKTSFFESVWNILRHHGFNAGIFSTRLPRL